MSHPRDQQAGEYVLGTLPAQERAAFERDLAQDADLRRSVESWQRSLVSLGDAVLPVEPPPQVWDAVERRIPSGSDTARGLDNVVSLEALLASRRRWRVAASTLGALAASLVAFIAAGRWTGPVGPAERLVAVVNRGGDLPALIIKVDARSGSVLVRPLSVERPSDRSLELWYIPPGQAPRSLGIVDDPTHVTAIAYGAPIPPDSLLAVTVEPSGGSPSKAPTGPVVYSGRLVPDDR